MRSKVAAMGDLQSKLEAVEAENRRLRAVASSVAAEGFEDVQATADAEALSAYEAARDEVVRLLGCGLTPSSDLYAERDTQLHRLADVDLQTEYRRVHLLRSLILALNSHSTLRLPDARLHLMHTFLLHLRFK